MPLGSLEKDLQRLGWSSGTSTPASVAIRQEGGKKEKAREAKQQRLIMREKFLELLELPPDGPFTCEEAYRIAEGDAESAEHRYEAVERVI